MIRAGPGTGGRREEEGLLSGGAFIAAQYMAQACEGIDPLRLSATPDLVRQVHDTASAFRTSPTAPHDAP